MTRVFFVDFENKCQNFIKKSISKVDTYYQRAEQPAEGSGELFHVHIFYRSDGPPTGLPGNRKWMTHHPIEPTGKNAADYAMIEAVQSYPIAKGDEIYVVCGGDRIYRQTFDPIPESYHIIDLNNTANVSPTQRNAEKAEIERECDRIEEVEARLYQEQMRSNLPNLEKRARERDDAILSAREEFETHTQAVRIEKQIDLRLKRSQDTFAQQVAKLQREWDNLADSTLEKNTARTPDSVPFVVPLVPFVAPTQ
ncbi:uncharacterized protein ACA1_395260 [Acanthamoeba castellanii str. Neff]|uniref:Uncharacterized protein n=1 Tax=Acanthamoeba castellanii (strain ATCC 30010 / Neff) TaxID=1257118 RepID=L8GZP1_ACACF|nr:uncharacterized protein ACA1_395260 [Acanthamoeba castellanii str. Neff]ELR18709.1 hypothetical protein ACA1_395260 [Acanthamoeba castellanii str. Neff]